MDVKVMTEFFKMKCQEIILDCEQATCSDDVDELEFTLCELDGMWKILQEGNYGKLLDEELRSGYYAAQAAFIHTHNRINYDPETGNPQRKGKMHG